MNEQDYEQEVIRIVSILIIGISIGALGVYFIFIVPEQNNTYTISELCASKLPYTNSTFEDYKNCLWYPEYYGVTK